MGSLWKHIETGKREDRKTKRKRHIGKKEMPGRKERGTERGMELQEAEWEEV